MSEYLKNFDYKFKDIEKARKFMANAQYSLDFDLDWINVAEGLLLWFANDAPEGFFGEDYKMYEAIERFLYSIGMSNKEKRESYEIEDDDELEEDGQWIDNQNIYSLQDKYRRPWSSIYTDEFDDEKYKSYLTEERAKEFTEAERKREESLTDRERFQEMFPVDGYIGDGVYVQDMTFDDDDEYYAKLGPM